MHLAIVDRHVAAHLRRGAKRIETRFSVRRRAPFGWVRRGDTVHFKVSGGGVIGTATVTRVRQFHKLEPAAIGALYRRYNRAVCASREYWRARRRCGFGVLMWITPLMPPSAQLHVPRQFGSGWVVLR